MQIDGRLLADSLPLRDCVRASAVASGDVRVLVAQRWGQMIGALASVEF